jgi:hypothetical protein
LRRQRYRHLSQLMTVDRCHAVAACVLDFSNISPSQ